MITTTMVAIDIVVIDCMTLFEQSFEVLTTLQEDLNIECLETKAHELEQTYDKVKGMVDLTQRLTMM